MKATNNSSKFYRAISKVGSLLKKNLKLFIGIAIGILFVIISEFFNSEMKWNEEQRLHNKAMSAQQTELIESKRNSALIDEMSHVVNQMHDDLNHDSKRMLSDETIARVAALSYSFTPYIHVDGDSISTKKLSPERGQLLLILAGMKMDTSSFKKLMQQSLFSFADLNKADLKNAYLKGANLQGAKLREANLEGVNLNEANLKSADLWGANLKHASLILADLTSAELSWANLNGASLQRAKCNTAVMMSTQMRKADLRDAVLVRVDFSGAFMNEANLEGANLESIMMNRTNLSAANLSEVNLSGTLTESNLTETNFSGATLGKILFLSGSVVTPENWLTLLNDWKVIGAKEIAAQYKLVFDSTALIPQYYLINRKK
jgi:uncharacterized protein YjbI with pentapeptide repeats